MRSPVCGSGQRAMSPAAKTPGALVSRYSSTTTPRSIASPACFGQRESRPHADADDDEIRREPRAVVEHDGVRARCASAVRPRWKTTPLLLVQRADEVAELGAEHALERHALPARRRATSSPRARSDAATSRPMKLAPITTARFAASPRAMIARLSASVRR